MSRNLQDSIDTANEMVAYTNQFIGEEFDDIDSVVYRQMGELTKYIVNRMFWYASNPDFRVTSEDLPAIKETVDAMVDDCWSVLETIN